MINKKISFVYSTNYKNDWFMSILKNAIDSLELGVEDCQSDQPKRLVSAVRNFYAGVLLLFKYKLALLSQENDYALLKQQVFPVQEEFKIVWKGKGKNTVDFNQIQKRFQSLDIKVDWRPLEKAKDYRNDIEHYYDREKTKPEVVRQYISGCFIVVCDFIRNQLSEDPKTLFDPTIWDSLIKVKDVYEADKKACSESLKKLEWISDITFRIFNDFTCNKCGSDLIEPLDISDKDSTDASFRCRVCDEEWNYEELLPLACEKESECDHVRIKDGGEPTFAYCPSCMEEYYNTDYEVCFNCGTKGPFFCSLCDNVVPICELQLYGSEGVCSWCCQVRMKDD